MEIPQIFPDPRAVPYRPSPFVQAALNGHLGVVKYITERYPKYVDHRDTVVSGSRRRRRWQFSSRFSSVIARPGLGTRGAVRFMSSEVHCCTALLAAAMRGHLDVARVLLKAGASTEVRLQRGHSSLRSRLSQPPRPCPPAVQLWSGHKRPQRVWLDSITCSHR